MLPFLGPCLILVLTLLCRSVRRSNNVELALSLANFIKSRAPPNTDQLLIMIYLRFHMVRDLAQVSRTKAEKCIERIQEHLDRADVVVDLDAAAEALQVAMESYEQAECYRNMRECMHLRSLVLLQRKLKPTPVLRECPILSFFSGERRSGVEGLFVS